MKVEKKTSIQATSPSKTVIDHLEEILSGNPWHVRPALKEYVAYLKDNPQEAQNIPVRRTGQQNRALHLWLTKVATELNNGGHTLQDVVAQIKRAEIRPTGENLKEVMLRPAQIAATGKQSSRDLEKLEVETVFEVLNKWLGENFEIHIPFPSYETDKEDAPLVTDKSHK